MRILFVTYIFFLASALYAPPSNPHIRPPCLTTVDEVVNSKSPPEFVRELLKDFDTWEKLPVYVDTQSAKFLYLFGPNKRGGGYERLEATDNKKPYRLFKKVSEAIADKNITHDITVNRVVNEARLALLFDWLDIGPKFYGVQITPDRHYALVYEYVEGAHIAPNYSYDNELVAAPSLGKAMVRIREIASILDSFDISIRDPQVRIKESGEVFIVDSEFFSLEKSQTFKPHLPNFI